MDRVSSPYRYAHARSQLLRGSGSLVTLELIQDTALTLEALTEYSKLGPRAALSQDINIRYRTKGPIRKVQLSQSRPVVSPIQVRLGRTEVVLLCRGRSFALLPPLSRRWRRPTTSRCPRVTAPACPRSRCVSSNSSNA